MCRAMGRPATGRRLHTAAFDELLQARGKTCAALARETGLSQSHLSNLRSGRSMVTPPVAAALSEALELTGADSILWPGAVA